MEKGLFAPRVGVTFRASPTMVLRGGFGITNDPYSLARPMRTNHPVLLNLIVNAPNTFSWAGRTADGVPPVPNADFGNGDHPDSVERQRHHDSRRSSTAATSSRGTRPSRRSCEWGFVGEAAYVATRQIDQLGFLELNWSPIGGGQAGRQLNQQVRTHRADAARRAGRRHQVRRAAGAARSTLRERDSSSASATRCRSRRGSPGRRAATACRAS